MNDQELIKILENSGLLPQWYEGEIGESNLGILRKIVEAAFEYYETQNTLNTALSPDEPLFPLFKERHTPALNQEEVGSQDF